MKSVVVLTIIAFLLPSAALAAETGACMEDKAKFCKDVKDVNACLEQHKDELSAACKARRAHGAKTK
jgi:hypothetical protein